jgi:glycosyltransferase involved in cell wall biosynthesis
MSRLRVLMVAYFCLPDKGSEEGVGWNVPCEMARHHEIWVITCEDNRPAIERELARRPQPGLHFVCWDLPRWARSWHRGRRGGHLHYYIWQLCILGIARSLHAKLKFDLIHHVTFVRYSTPSFVCFLGVPFVWGPVGGGESAPRCFWWSAGWWFAAWEGLRELARWLAERGPFLRATARRSAIAIATNPETTVRLCALGCKSVVAVSQVGLHDDEFAELGSSGTRQKPRLRFVSVGNQLQWKGNDIALRALSLAKLADAEYWLIGDGPDRGRLEELSVRLGIADRVRFCGRMPRREVFSALSDCDAMLHPSLHDSGGFVVAEAMAARLPVICLDLGGPAVQVTADCGFKIAARDPERAARDIAAAIIQLAQDEKLRRRLGHAARERVRQNYLWHSKAEHFNAIYRQVLAGKDGGRQREKDCGGSRRPPL